MDQTKKNPDNAVNVSGFKLPKSNNSKGAASMQEDEPKVKPPKHVKGKGLIKFNEAGVPDDLRALKRWICWKYVDVNGKSTKHPYDPITGYKTDATVTSNGHSFDIALAALKDPKKKLEGLGIILGDGIGGVDMDSVRDPKTGELNERGARVSAMYRNTYAELSPSGEGFKVIVDIGADPKLAAIGKQEGETELYGGRRFFTITGQLLSGHPSQVTNQAVAFEETAREIDALKTHVDANAILNGHKDAVGMTLQETRQMLDFIPFHWCEDFPHWLKLGMALHHEYDGSADALELWDEYSQRCGEKYNPDECETRWDSFGRPGKDFYTIRGVANDAVKAGWTPPYAIRSALDEFSSLLDEQPDEDWWAKDSMADLLNTQPGPVRWLWNGILKEGKLMILGGHGGSSKSYMALAASMRLCLGQSFGPFEAPENAPQRKALLIYAEEDLEDVHYRVNQFKNQFMFTEADIDRLSSNLKIMAMRGQRITLAEQDGDRKTLITKQMAQLKEKIKDYGVNLLVLDPLAMVHSLDENDNVAIADLVRGFDSLCKDTGVSIILVHHFGKSVAKAREVSEANLRGASALSSHARTVAVMHAMQELETEEWGIPSSDFARWVMFRIVKNNYGGTFQGYWMNKDNGVLTEAPTQPVYMPKSQAARVQRDARLVEELKQEMGVDTQLTTPAGGLSNVTEMEKRVQLVLEMSMKNGKLPGRPTIMKMLMAAKHPFYGDRHARGAIDFIKQNGLVDNSGVVTSKGVDFVDNLKFLE